MLSLRLIFQIIRFGLVGAMVTPVHFLLAVVLIGFDIQPLWANFFAFIIAFHLSFFGHFYWTFAHAQAFRYTTALRYLCVAAFVFGLNEGLYFCLLRWTAVSPQWLLFWVLLFVSVVNFQLSRFWVFKMKCLDPI